MGKDNQSKGMEQEDKVDMDSMVLDQKLEHHQLIRLPIRLERVHRKMERIECVLLDQPVLIDTEWDEIVDTCKKPPSLDSLLSYGESNMDERVQGGKVLKIGKYQSSLIGM